MSQTMSYDQQEEFCFQVLRVAPVPVTPAAMAIFFQALGYTLTRSNFAEAQRRLQELPKLPETKKEQYLIALFSIAPDLRAGLVHEKSKAWFGEDTRGDRIEHWRGHAQRFPMDKVEARLLVQRTESATRNAQGAQPMFNLTEEP